MIILQRPRCRAAYFTPVSSFRTNPSAVNAIVRKGGIKKIYIKAEQLRNLYTFVDHKHNKMALVVFFYSLF